MWKVASGAQLRQGTWSATRGVDGRPWVRVWINTKWVMGLPVLARVFAVSLLVLSVSDF